MLCILIAGLPASGKTTLARHLAKLLALPMFSKDEIKELLYDTAGFRSRAEKVALGNAAMKAMYYAAGAVLAAGGSVILENNFENSSRPGVQALLKQYACPSVTVMLTGDSREIYQRFLAREKSPDRHRGHIVNTCYPEPPGKKADCVPVSYEQFMSGAKRRGMCDFDIGGPRIVVDGTDFQQVDPLAIAAQIQKFM